MFSLVNGVNYILEKVLGNQIPGILVSCSSQKVSGTCCSAVLESLLHCSSTACAYCGVVKKHFVCFVFILKLTCPFALGEVILQTSSLILSKSFTNIEISVL